MSRWIKRLFKSNTIKSSHIANNLSKLIEEEVTRKLICLDLINTKEVDFYFILNCSYFFSYLLATRNNDINMNSKSIENITRNFANSLVDDYIKKYNLDKNQKDKYINKLLKETKDLLELYENSKEKSKTISIRKTSKILLNNLEGNNFDKLDFLSDLIISNITLCQDFLLNISRKYSIIK